jgi:glycosyltransferase involved in cell wall biosynthesis
MGEKSQVLSIIVPAFNEEATIKSILSRIGSVELMGDIGKEVLVIDDCSTDKTLSMTEEYQRENPDLTIKIIVSDKNAGKGASIHRGIEAATGDLVVVQDADLEYDPREYNDLLKPILEGFADVVYGSRFMGSNPHRILFFWHSLGNQVLTGLSNLFSNLNLTDMETCYKMFRADTLKGLVLREKRFGFEPEVTAKVARVPGVRIYEVGISYYGRTYNEGKKINWKDGVWAIYCILRYNLFG